MALLTVADVQAAYPSIADRADLASLVVVAEASVKGYLGRAALELASGLEHEAIGGGWFRVWLPEYPIASVASVAVDGSAWAADRYEVRASLGALHYRCLWPRGSKIAVVYEAGYAPGAPELALCKQAALLSVAVQANLLSDGITGPSPGAIVETEHRDYREKRAASSAQLAGEKGFILPPYACSLLRSLKRVGATGGGSPK